MDIANLFAETWSKQSEDDNFSESFNLSKNSTVVSIDYQPNRISKLLEEDLTYFEIQSTLKSLKGKTPGFDKISYPILKNLPPNINKHLLQLFNLIFTTGIIPQQWKTSTIIPIPKPKKDITSVDGYRPISLIPCASKLLEKIIATRITWFLLKNQLLSNHQVAFKPNKGTLDALIYIDHITANTLSHKNHLSIISIDFEKAFDRGGIHTIIMQLKEWKFGPKIINFIYAFLTKRKIRTKVNKVFSSIKPLHNGIPQGSPLSVILFQIATNKLNKIISNNRFFKHVIYADDLYILSKHSNNVNLQDEIDNLFVSLNNWCNLTGAKISIPKTKCLHICKKKLCNNNNIVIQGNQIEFVDTLKILGVLFNRSFSWSSHIDNLKKALQPRLNLIKCLAAKRSNSHPNIILNAVRSLILSKIDYGIAVYGKAPKSTFNKINPTYNSSIRIALGAFKTTPILNLMAESGLPTLIQRFNSHTAKLITKIVFPTEQHLLNRIAHIPSQLPLKFPSTICLTFKHASKMNIVTKPEKVYFPKEPPWKLKNSSFLQNLMGLPKESTHNSIYIALFNELATSYKSRNWKFLYTDGSKTDTATSMAIINENLQTDFLATLDQRSSIFAAESTAIFYALNKYKNIRGKYIICTDSKSSVTSIQNIKNKNITISKIRDILIKFHTKFKLMWIPSHIGITGNSLADEAAKFATHAPIMQYLSPNKKDINKIIFTYIKELETEEWANYHHHYKNINPHKTKPTYPPDASRADIQKYTRLRLGHTFITHQHLFNNSRIENCPLCNTNTISIQHLIFNCNVINQAQLTLLNKICFPDLLQKINTENIKKVNNILKYCNIYHLI